MPAMDFYILFRIMHRLKAEILTVYIDIVVSSQSILPEVRVDLGQCLFIRYLIFDEEQLPLNFVLQ